MRLGENFLLQEIKKHLFSKIVIIFYPCNLTLITHSCNSDFWKHLWVLREFMGVRAYIS